jgi:hypothetical protein
MAAAFDLAAVELVGYEDIVTGVELAVLGGDGKGASEQDGKQGHRISQIGLRFHTHHLLAEDDTASILVCQRFVKRVSRIC